MSLLQIVRRPKRKALLIAMDMSKGNPGLLFPIQGVEPGELDDLIRAILAKQGVTDEAMVQAVMKKAEEDSEARLKVCEARAKIRKALAIRHRGVSITQKGDKSWVATWFMGLKNRK